ncbi:hypothetical protein FXN61_25450 [Lentzea sp. PSKA42]|uniref:Nucleotidyltransferase domain-containing protein n=1 Tax=Lentzea indica TaxID=2604800 RepID=A0ABX1FLV0_9PSEU|nr:hypothetical protein [Lentzea indica]NKE59963.1 hypothetical protein [Lentzea indica]
MNAQVQHRYVCEVLLAANRTANWGRTRGLYEQIRHIHRSARPVPGVVRDALAEDLAGLAFSYEGQEHLFAEHALGVLAEVDGRETFDSALFLEYYLDRSGVADGFPSLLETVVETSRRHRDARRFAQALAGTSTSCVLCGSMSYGPFYNVHGHHDEKPASDLDLVIVIDNAAQLDGIAERMLGLDGVDHTSVEQLRARAAVFVDRFDDGATAFSHKVRLWTNEVDQWLDGTGLRGDYVVSLHFLTRRVLGYVLVESSAELTRSGAGRLRNVRDFRDTATQRADLPRTFAGREYPAAPQVEEVEAGWLRWATAYLFDETDSYCPGFLQTILLPEPKVLWDGLGVRAPIVTFVRKLHDRCRLERGSNPNALLRPSLAHVRLDVFAPHVVRRFDQDV